jgi:hypothetical protein
LAEQYHGADGGDIHDRAGAALEHRRQHCARHQVRAAQRDGERAVPRLRRRLEQRLQVLQEGRVVDEQARRPELAAHPLDRGVDLRLVGDVAADRERPGAGAGQLRSRRGGGLGVDVEESDGGSLGGQALGGRPADAVGGARHHHHAPVEPGARRAHHVRGRAPNGILVIAKPPSTRSTSPVT